MYHSSGLWTPYQPPAPLPVPHGYGRDQDDRALYSAPIDFTQPPPQIYAAPQDSPPQGLTAQGCIEAIEKYSKILKEQFDYNWPPLPSQNSNSSAGQSAGERERSTSNTARGGSNARSSPRSQQQQQPARERHSNAPARQERTHQFHRAHPAPTNHMSMKLQPPQQKPQPLYRHAWGAPAPSGRNKKYQTRQTLVRDSRNGDKEREYRVRARLLVRLHKENCPPPADNKCKIIEKNGNILASSEKFKAIPIAADFAPYGGLAGQVLDFFGKPTETNRVRPGEIVEHKFDADLTWLFLVTAERSYHRAKSNFEEYLQNVETALDNLAAFIKTNKVREIAIPYLCSGRRHLNWLYVKDLISTKLKEVDVTVAVYHLGKTTKDHVHHSSANESTSLVENAPITNLSDSTQVDCPIPNPTPSLPSSLLQVENPMTDGPCREEEILSLNPSASNQASASAGLSSIETVPQPEPSTAPRQRGREYGPAHNQRRLVTRSASSPAGQKWCRAHVLLGCQSCYPPIAPLPPHASFQ
jgi:hypothetical protein